MMRKRWIYVGFGVSGLLLVLVAFLLWVNDSPWKREEVRPLIYGKVLDQHGDPVEGVKVMVTVSGNEMIFVGWPWERHNIRKYMFKDKDKEEEIVRHSNEEGRFTIESDFDSSSIEFDEHSFHKDGYIGPIDARSGYSFHYDDPPDSSKPVIFHMWKRSADPPKRLIKRRDDYSFDATGKWFTGDLITGKDISIKHPQADLIVSSRVQVEDAEDPRSPYDWELTLEMSKGGIQRNTSYPYRFLAPEDGYQKTIVWKGKSKDRRKYWGSFYLRSYEGRVYASVYIEAEFKRKDPKWELRPTEDGYEYFKKDPEDGGHPYVEIYYNWLINPFGSRSLEYDPYRYEKLKKQRESGELKLSTEEFWKLVDDEDPVRDFDEEELKAIVELLQQGKTPKAKDYQ